jgi:hypothetical protein
MIQRIQSVYLLLIFLISALMMFVNPNFAKFSNTKAEKISAELRFVTKHYFNQSDPGTAPYDKLNLILIVFLGIGSLYTLFLYKKTELQKKMSLYLALLSMGLLLSLVLDFVKMSGDLPEVSSYPSFHVIWPVGCIVLSVLTWAAIRRDENLLKSMDRIR